MINQHLSSCFVKTATINISFNILDYPLKNNKKTSLDSRVQGGFFYYYPSFSTEQLINSFIFLYMKTLIYFVVYLFLPFSYLFRMVSDPIFGCIGRVLSFIDSQHDTFHVILCPVEVFQYVVNFWLIVL